jgi:hypothetical protein
VGFVYTICEAFGKIQECQERRVGNIFGVFPTPTETFEPWLRASGRRYYTVEWQERTHLLAYTMTGILVGWWVGITLGMKNKASSCDLTNVRTRHTRGLACRSDPSLARLSSWSSWSSYIRVAISKRECKRALWCKQGQLTSPKACLGGTRLLVLKEMVRMDGSFMMFAVVVVVVGLVSMAPGQIVVIVGPAGE